MRGALRALQAGAIAASVSAGAVAIGLAQGTPSPKPAAAPGTKAPGTQAPAPGTHAPGTQHSAPSTQHPAPADLTPIVKRYCVGCHNENGKAKAGDLSLATFDATHAAQNTE